MEASLQFAEGKIHHSLGQSGVAATPQVALALFVRSLKGFFTALGEQALQAWHSSWYATEGGASLALGYGDHGLRPWD
jgi:hypothetical protein